MSLRRSPRRTPAFLAANRANAQKSTGPRTEAGKQRSAANAFRNGNRASAAFWTRGLSHRELAEFYALRDALDRALYAGSAGQKLVRLAAAMVGAGWRPCIDNREVADHARRSTPACLSNRKRRDGLRKEFGADGRWSIVKLRESVEARLSEAQKTAKKSSGSLVQVNPSSYLSPEIGVNPSFTPPRPEIFRERTQGRKPKQAKELGPE